MLTQKQKRQLKSIAMTENALYQIGKNEISDNAIDMLDKALTARELVKISVLNTVVSPIRELALDLAGALKAEVVQIIGHMIVLYRKNPNKTIIELGK